MLWAFAAIAVIELFVVHFLVSIWSVPFALILSAFTLAGMVWLVLLIRSFRRLPVLLDEGGVLFKCGSLISIQVPLGQIEAVRAHFSSEALKSRAVLNLAMLSCPNVLVELRAPIARGRRSIDRVAHRLDDPGGFVAALAARLDRPAVDP
jgi:hypothetical protein